MKNMVSLVGAGIGCWDMISVRGLQCIQSADFLIYDRLLDERLLDYAPESCEKIYVGKAAGSHYMKQEDINLLLAEKAANGGHVVRLKGGDPYVFGRGGEEALFLEARNIPFQVVPGVTSAVAGACFAGIPVTHRELAREFHVATAHTSHGGFEPEDYKRLAALEGTLVLLMGLSQTGDIAQGLIEAGKSKATPTAVISCAGTPRQQTVESTLEHLEADVCAAQLPSPAIIVIGAVVELRKELDFRRHMPLSGKRILLTHGKRQNDVARDMLVQAGAAVDSAPMIEIEELKKIPEAFWGNLEQFSYIVFTSVNAVEIFMKQLWESGKDSRSMGKAKLAAVGPATVEKLCSYGLRADIIPPKFNARALAEELSSILTMDDWVILPQAAKADTELFKQLSSVCSVERIELYDTRLPQKTMSREEFITANYSAVTFASSSAVKNFDSEIGLDTLRKCSVFSIGEATAKALRAAGLEPYVGNQCSFPALAETIIGHYSEG